MGFDPLSLAPGPWGTIGSLDNGGQLLGAAGVDTSGIGGFLGVGAGDPSNPYRQGLANVGAGAAGFAGQAAGNYGQDTAALEAQRRYLQGLASGQNSVTAEQLRQALQQQLAQQQSMAAGASPNNAAMAARIAAMNMQRSSYGMAGQQAIAGLQERNQANQALANLNLGARGQDVQGAIGGYGAASGAYGTAVQNPQKTWGSVLLPAASSAASMAASGGGGAGAGAGGAAMSDRRVKHDVEDGAKATNQIIDGLKAYTFKYKNEKHGKGKQVGVMAQDLEKAGLKHAVFDTPEGKAVHGAKLATANTAMLAELGRRVKKLEKAR